MLVARPRPISTGASSRQPRLGCQGIKEFSHPTGLVLTRLVSHRNSNHGLRKIKRYTFGNPRKGLSKVISQACLLKALGRDDSEHDRRLRRQPDALPAWSVRVNGVKPVSA